MPLTETFLCDIDKIYGKRRQIGIFAVSNDQVVEDRRLSYRKSKDSVKLCCMKDIALRCENSAESFGSKLDTCLAAAGEERDRRLDMILLKELSGSPSGILIWKIQDKGMISK